MLQKPTSNPWLVIQRPNPRATLRLFCFPYAGGSALVYRTWADSLPPHIETCALQLPGRGSRMREPPLLDLMELVEVLAPVLEPYFDKPFAFFGHSMGATISFEMVRLLARQGKTLPQHLFVSGRRAPQFPETDRPTYNLPEPEFIEELRRLNGTPRELLENPELMQLMLPLLRADFTLCQTYTLGEAQPLACPITAYGGLQDTCVTREHLEGWRPHTDATFALRMLPGDHFFLHAAQPALLRSLASELSPLGQAVSS